MIPFLTGETWNPTFVNPAYGILPLIVGTVLVTIAAMVIAVPLSVASAIYLSEIASYRVKAAVKPVIELLAGIPSVVFGFFGLLVLVEWIRVTFAVPSGECVLAGGILLGIMSLPTIISVSEDALAAVPREFREGSLALGATQWQTIIRVVVPAALSGITAAIILGMGRAIGETMAVLMVTGNAAVIPEPLWNVLSPVRTLTGTLGIEMGEVAIGSLHYHALFAVATVLLVITLAVNLGATGILKRLKTRETGAASTGKRVEPSRFAGITRHPLAGKVVLGLIALLLAGMVASTGGLLDAGAVLIVIAVLALGSSPPLPPAEPAARLPPPLRIRRGRDPGPRGHPLQHLLERAPRALLGVPDHGAERPRARRAASSRRSSAPSTSWRARCSSPSPSGSGPRSTSPSTSARTGSRTSSGTRSTC